MILTLEESALRAFEEFCTFTDGEPNLLETGFECVDQEIGGLKVGEAALLGAATGAGKSNLMLYAAMRCKRQVGIVAMEDPATTVGPRASAYYSYVNPKKIRRKHLSAPEIEAARNSLASLRNHNVLVDYQLAANLPQVVESIHDLSRHGCETVWVDYIQKIKGIGTRTEFISLAFTEIQRACYEANVGCIVISQFSRKSNEDGSPEPRLSWFKESGDLENECRLALLAWVQGGTVHLKVGKSTEGAGAKQMFLRNPEFGLLEPYSAPSMDYL